MSPVLALRSSAADMWSDDGNGWDVVDEISVMIVEDHAMVAEGLSIALEREDDIEVGDIAMNLEDAVALTRERAPDVVLMDFRLPDGDAIDGMRQLREHHPDLPVVIITAHTSPELVERAVEAGCSGFLHKTKNIEQVSRSVRAAARGEVMIAPDVLSALVGHVRTQSEARDDLTDRELEVLRLLARGKSTQAMADELGVSIHTVRNHVRNLTQKVGAHSKLEAVTAALRDGILTMDDLR